MKYSVAAVIAAAAGAVAVSNVTVTTEVVDVYTTYCPEATQITHGTKTWTVTEATTLTITDCPCTITRPITTTSSVVCNDCAVPTTAVPTIAVPSNNATVPVNPPAPTTAVPTTVPPTTGGAGKAVPVLAGVFGLVAALL